MLTNAFNLKRQQSPRRLRVKVKKKAEFGKEQRPGKRKTNYNPIYNWVGFHPLIYP